MSKKIGHQRWQILFIIALQTASAGAMSTATLDNPVKSIILTCIISACTSAVICNCLIIVGFGIVYQEDIGSASGIAGTSRLLFGAVATAIFSNVTTNKYKTELPGQIADGIKGLGFTGSVASLVKAAIAGSYVGVAGLTPAVQAATVLANKQAYIKGAHESYLIALAFGLVGCICAFFIPSIDTRKFTKKTVALQESDRKQVELKRKEGGA
jgi:Fungal trichothecene efflux pump (TRI12)